MHQLQYKFNLKRWYFFIKSNLKSWDTRNRVGVKNRRYHEWIQNI